MEEIKDLQKGLSEKELLKMAAHVFEFYRDQLYVTFQDHRGMRDMYTIYNSVNPDLSPIFCLEFDIPAKNKNAEPLKCVIQFSVLIEPEEQDTDIDTETDKGFNNEFGYFSGKMYSFYINCWFGKIFDRPSNNIGCVYTDMGAFSNTGVEMFSKSNKIVAFISNRGVNLMVNRDKIDDTKDREKLIDLYDAIYYQAMSYLTYCMYPEEIALFNNANNIKRVEALLDKIEGGVTNEE